MFQEEFRRFINQLEVLKEKNVLLGNHHLVNKLAAMQEAANRAETQVSTIQAISSSMRLNDLNGSTTIAETDVGSSLKSDRKGNNHNNIYYSHNNIYYECNFNFHNKKNYYYINHEPNESNLTSKSH